MSTPSQTPSLLVTGASGFIGSFVVEEGLRRGFDVWAAVRPTSSRAYLTDERIHFIELDLGTDDALRQQLVDHVTEHGAWNYVVHAAGVTKCRRMEDFARVNTEGTVRLARLLMETKALKHRLVFISSLSICGALHERDYAPLTTDDTPQPNTAYGRSKYAAELALKEMQDLDYVVLRPTGVYGPRERDYYLMAQSIKQHVDFAVGYRRQVITFIYVTDLVRAIYAALERGERGAAYFLSDGREYSSRTFSLLLQRAMGVRHVLHITAPVWFLRLLCAVCGTWAAWRGKTTTLNADKYNIMKQRNWRCDISPARRDLGYEPQVSLEQGVSEAVAWYKKEKWL